jgi:RHS repeat-associated protein
VWLNSAVTQCVQISGITNWWRAEGDASDTKGAANGTLVNSPVFTQGKVGQAFSFNGNNTYVGLPDNFFPYPASGTGTTPFTFDAWFKTTSGGVILGQQGGVSPFANPGNAFVAGLYVGNDGKLYSHIFSNGHADPISSATTVNDGVFHHVAVTYDGAVETTYLDGVSIGTKTFGQLGYSTDYKYQLGTGFTSFWPNINGGWVTFNGLIDEARVFNRALSAAEAQSIFNADSQGVCGPTAVNQPPVVSAGPNQTITLPTSSVTLNGSATDDGLPNGTLTITWSEVSGPAGVTFSSPHTAVTNAMFPGAGSYVLQLSATDSQFTTNSTVTVMVNAAPPPPPPPGTVTVQIVSPADGSAISSQTAVVANISGGNWTLDYALNGDDGLTGQTYTTIATGSGAVTNAAIGTFDPTLLLNGTYTIRLTSLDSAGNASVTSVSGVVRGQKKIGNFTISFNDLTVPLAGLPITVTRTYDSRDKRPGDFGIGWTLGIANIRVEKSGNIGKVWSETSDGGVIPNYCVQPVHPKVVTITFPDGKQYKFQAAPNPSCQQAAPFTQATMGYTQLQGDSGTGGATLIATGDNSVIADASVPGLFNWISVSGGVLYNPTQFQLSTAEGYVYVVDEKLGLLSLTDPNGNKLTVNSGGIIHSSGKSIVFTRDAQGRITKITDPNGNVLSYNVNAAGDLTGFTDAVGNTTNFSYNGTHGLLTVTDPRGITPVTNNYDANGRLISTTDANGKTISFNHDLAAHHDTVTDRLGNVTVFEYDDDGNVTKTTDALTNVTSYTYDSHDNKLTETSALGNTTTYVYDGFDNLTSQTDPLGNKTSFTYDGARRPLTVTDARGGVTTNTYDLKGNLKSTKDPLGNVTSYTYNQAGLVQTTTDAAGGVTTLGYDGVGNVTSQTDALGHVTTFSYDSNNNRTSQAATRTNAGVQETLTTSYKYDSKNRLIQTTYPDGTTSQVVYNSIGKQAATIDQLGRQTSFQDDSQGRLSSSTYPDGTSESSTYDNEGRRVTSTDRAGRVTSFTYDVLGRLTKTTFVDGASTSTGYDAIGEVTSSTDANLNTATYGYDKSGRRTSVTDALSNVTSFAYDANGNQSSMTDARNNTTSFQYDAANRRTAVVYADSTSDSTGYDSLGRTVSKTDQAGKLTQYGYDKLGRLTSVTDALGHVTSYGYDELGEQTTQTDALSRPTSFQYDKLGRRVKRTLPLGMSEIYSYDQAGNMLTRTDFDGKKTTYSYDQVNRLLSKTPDPSFNAAAITFSYTATGRRASMTDPSGSTSYSYDSRDRLLSKATPQGTLSYTYDLGGNLLTTQSSNSNGINIGYSYDKDNRLETVSDNAPVSGTRPGTGTTTYSYDPAGNLAGYLYPNGVQTSYTYNTLNRLTGMGSAKGATNLSSYTYTLGAAGNRLSVSELSGRTVNYSYDDIYRLTGEAISTDPTPANNGSISYNYDAVGNRLARNSTIAAVPSTTSIYDANDRLGSDGYDNNGSTTSSAGKTYTYDFENRIISVNNGAIALVYDGDGNRVAKTVNGVTTKFLVDDNNPTGYAQVVEELSSGSVSRAYTYGHMLVGQTQLVGGNWTPSFYGLDGHGSVRFLADSSGAITDTYDYDAFGTLIHETGSTPNVYLYSGEQRDSGLGLDYLRFRYLNPASGRFWTTDPFEGVAGEPKSIHRYLYANIDPVNLVDPSGLVPLPFPFSVIVGKAVDVYIRGDFINRSPTTRTGNISIRVILRDLRQIRFVPPLIFDLLRPDLVEFVLDRLSGTRAVYEIKTILGASDAVSKLAIYLGILNAFDFGWAPGLEYKAPAGFICPTPVGPYSVVTLQPLPGVILYDANPYGPKSTLLISTYAATLLAVTFLLYLTTASLTLGRI